MLIEKLEKVNAYSRDLFSYPGVIFPGFDLDQDIYNLQSQLKDFDSIILEFGSGSGEHLIGLSEYHPKSLVIGFEIRFKRAVRTIEKAKQKNISNIRVFRGLAELSKKIFSEKSISELYINFPDPWDKKRWLKHRILTEKSLNNYLPLLKSNGIVSVKTDHEEYFDSFISELSTMQVNILELNKDHQESTFLSANIKTEFEKLFRSQNKKINYVRFQNK